MARAKAIPNSTLRDSGERTSMVVPLVAGGRYDGLMTQLGAATPIPAVGFSVWVEALTKLGRAPAASKRGKS